jgi:catechol 2,3-dioxygenase-like lactoylglutathione lyase family enzyme
LIRYAHTNLVAHDWRRLADFYIAVFDCREVPPPRKQAGLWLEEGTGVAGLSLEGMHLRLPGWGEDGPTLEIYSYRPLLDVEPAVTRRGFGHLAFQVVNVAQILEKAIACGGKSLGKVTQREIEGVGALTFVYLADPEGNVIEIQRWN